MPNDAIAATLSAIEIFRGLKPGQLARIAGCAERMVFRAGQPIITAGNDGDGAYVLFGGTAEVAPDEDVAARTVEAGSLVGEMAMLIEHRHRITVVARESVRALKISRAALHAEMLRDPALAEHFVSRISSRLTRLAVEMRRVDQMLALARDGASAAVPQPSA